MAPQRTPLQVIDRVIGVEEVIGVTIQDNLGVAIDLTGLTLTVELYLMSDDSEVGSARSATIVSAANGQISFQPTAADVASARRMAVYAITDETPAREFPFDGARIQLNVKARGTGA